MLANTIESQRFEPFFIDHLVDQRGRFDFRFEQGFPLSIKFYSFAIGSNLRRLNWHERLELFVPVGGQGRFRMGNQSVDFSGGDIIVVDNRKLHGLAEFRGPRRDAVVVTFMPDLIYNVGSCLCDFVLLSPFYCLRSGMVPVLRSTDRLAAAAHRALRNLVKCYTGTPNDARRQAGCKAYLSELLYHLTRRFGQTEIVFSEFSTREQQSQRLGKLFELVEKEYAEKLSIADAAAIVAMSESQFIKFFKRATGMTFVDYVTRVRLNQAYKLLVETEASIAEVAYSVGFCDQSYFTRRFKETFGWPPRELRSKKLT